MTVFVIRYTPGTQLHARFGDISLHPWKATGYPTREAAETIRAACPNAEHMDIVQIEENP